MFEGCVAPIPSLVIGGAVQKSIVVLIMNAVPSFASQPIRLIFVPSLECPLTWQWHDSFIHTCHTSFSLSGFLSDLENLRTKA